MIQNKQAEIKAAIQSGKYTLLGVSEWMATTTKQEIEILEIRDVESWAQYRNLSMIVFKGRGKRKVLGSYVRDSTLLLKGWNLGLMTDTEDKESRTFSGNALINLRGAGPEIRQIIDAAYVYGNKGIVIYKAPGCEIVGDGFPLYPIEAAKEAGNHAVLARIIAA